MARRAKENLVLKSKQDDRVVVLGTRTRKAKKIPVLRKYFIYNGKVRETQSYVEIPEERDKVFVLLSDKVSIIRNKTELFDTKMEALKSQGKGKWIAGYIINEHGVVVDVYHQVNESGKGFGPYYTKSGKKRYESIPRRGIVYRTEKEALKALVDRVMPDLEKANSYINNLKDYVSGKKKRKPNHKAISISVY